MAGCCGQVGPDVRIPPGSVNAVVYEVFDGDEVERFDTFGEAKDRAAATGRRIRSVKV